MKVEKGIVKQPHFILLYGVEGCGKSSLASEAPKPIFLDPERGSRALNVERNTNITTFDDVMNSLKWLRDNKHDYQTVVIDSLDHIEPMVWAHTCQKNKNVNNIEEVGGGYQKGYLFAIDYWREIIEMLQELRNKKQMNVVCIAHSKVVTINDPSQPLPYDRHTLKLHENKQCTAIGLWKESTDAVLFISFDDVVFKTDQKDKKAKTAGGEKRVIHTQRTPAWDAKNRYGLPAEIPYELGDGWKTLTFAAEKAVVEPIKETIEQVTAEILDIQKRLSDKDKETADKMLIAATKSRADLEKLINIRNHARTLVGE